MSAIPLFPAEGAVAAAGELGFTCVGKEDFPVHGPAGNREVFVHLRPR